MMQTSPHIHIRVARDVDLPAITSIYNEAILTGTATFDTEPKTLEDRQRWFSAREEKHVVLVAVVDDKVLGWASLNPWSDRRAYAGTVENSVYVATSAQGCGIGKALLMASIASARQTGIHTIIARITAGSDASISLHRRLGFQDIGTLKEVGVKFGKLLDVHLLQIILQKNS